MIDPDPVCKITNPGLDGKITNPDLDGKITDPDPGSKNQIRIHIIGQTPQPLIQR